MQAGFVSMAVTVLDFVFFLNFAVKWMTSTVTCSVLCKVLHLLISMASSKFVLYCGLARLMLID